MEYEIWETFISLAETNSFTRTAELQNLSQTTVTNRIKQLEKQLGKQLFIRDTRSVKLSEAGNVLLPFAKKAIQTLKLGVQMVRSYADFDDTLSIGSLISIWHYYLLPFVDQLKAEHSSYSLQIHTGPTKKMFDLLLDGTIDVCVVPARAHHPDVDSLLLFEEPFYLVGSSDIKGIGSKQVSADQLSAMPFIHIPWETPFTEWYHNEIGTQLFPSIEVDDTTLYMRFLLEKQMIGFLPEIVARPHLQKKELRKLEFKSIYPMPTRKVYLIYHKKNGDAIALQEFKNLLFKSVNSLNL